MLVESIDPGSDTFRILLTTDNHVGYNENDPIRGDDGWKTFDEILNIARDSDVDMVVQGGDLFHINKPSKKSMFQVMKSLRANCMGDKPCEVELLSDPRLNIDNGFDTVNYEDGNFNISIPVFAISGNHDDATGDGLLSPLDLLSVSGLINHFGKIHDNENITVSPLLFQKGSTKLALYGLPNIRDERLHRTFRDGKVTFHRPAQDTQSWFNLFCIHQNHAQHSITSSIPENFLPNFLDLVFWGHEHECVPHPVHNPEMGFDVLQGGSSIATSLSEGEMADKHVFIMSIKGNNYSIKPIRLKTVRPFIMKELHLQQTNLLPGAASRNDVIAYLDNEADKAIEEAKSKYIENNSQQDSTSEIGQTPAPLIRLRVEYSGGYEIENTRRFSNRFVGKVANVNDVIQFYKRKSKETDITKKAKFVDSDLFKNGAADKKSTEIQLSDLMVEFLSQTELALVPEAGIQHAVSSYIENEDKNVLENYIKLEIKNETNVLLNIDIDVDEFHGDDNHAKNVFKQVLKTIKLDNLREKYLAEHENTPERDVEIANKPKRGRKSTKSTEVQIPDSDEDVHIVDDSSEDEETTRKPTRTRRAPAKTTRKPRGRKTGKTLHDNVMNI
jgi:double-strand break repair protein MRE11